MKTFLLLPLVLALPASAGTSAKQVIAPAPDPCIMSWFAGASVGYLTQLEEPAYTAHVGITNTCWTVAGWNTSLVLEVGYTNKDEDYSGSRQRDPVPPVGGAAPNPKNMSVSLDELGQLLQYGANQVVGGRASYDLDIVPITLNVKLERALTGNLNAYFGAGLGIAYTGLDIKATTPVGIMSDSDSSWVFVAQVFAGLSYNVTPAFEVYGGARWVYLADADYSIGGEDFTLELGNDCFLELGARYHF